MAGQWPSPAQTADLCRDLKSDRSTSDLDQESAHQIAATDHPRDDSRTTTTTERRMTTMTSTTTHPGRPDRTAPSLAPSRSGGRHLPGIQTPQPWQRGRRRPIGRRKSIGRYSRLCVGLTLTPREHEYAPSIRMSSRGASLSRTCATMRVLTAADVQATPSGDLPMETPSRRSPEFAPAMPQDRRDLGPEAKRALGQRAVEQTVQSPQHARSEAVRRAVGEQAVRGATREQKRDRSQER